ncbi:MAG: DUF6786 family protein [Alistipes sp.]
MLKSGSCKIGLLAGVALMLTCCSEQKIHQMGSYGYDAKFFQDNNIKYTELISSDGQSKVMIVPDWQGRVMTSSAEGDDGDSYGWINYRFIKEGQEHPQFNPVGGEERFWLGPEGGPYSLYFQKGQEQVYDNWHVPPVIDTEPFEISAQNDNKITFVKNTCLKNAAQTEFKIGIERTIELMDSAAISAECGVCLSHGVKVVAYRTNNKITNIGEKPWQKETGLISIWMLGMFNPTPTTTVFIPYRTDVEGVIVNDEYFGKIPVDRLKVENGIIYFKIDGTYRSKLGLPAHRAKTLCGSYDSSKGMLTLLWCSLPEGPAAYVNGQWGPQVAPFDGDVINSYNDGPVEDGSIMGPFYEMETSSPGAELAPGESLTHTQKIIHIQGDEIQLSSIVKDLFGVELSNITTKFQ